VQNCIEAVRPNEPADEGFIADVAALENGALGDGRGTPRREVVDDDHAVAGIQELERHVAADIAGTTGHKRAHCRPLDP
jgi:hypothetical protein